jgi:hypothetical protein
MKVLTGLVGTILLLTCVVTSPGAMQLKMVVEQQLPDGTMLGRNIIFADPENGINMEFQGEDQHGGMVWNKAGLIAWMIDFMDSTYWTMTEEDAAKVKKMRQEMMPRMEAQQEQMKKLFEEQMKNLSEEEKKAAMQHLPGGMGMGMDQEEERNYEKDGTETVDPWGNAVIYILRQHGQMVEKVWTVGWDQLGVDEKYLGVFSEFGEFAGGFMEGEEGGGPFDIAHIEEEQGYPGVAVKKETYDRNGALESTEMLKELKTEESDPDNYRLPKKPPLEETDSPFDEMPTDMPEMPPMPPGH